MLQKCREVEREKYWQKPVKWERAAEVELQDWKKMAMELSLGKAVGSGER